MDQFSHPRAAMTRNTYGSKPHKGVAFNPDKSLDTMTPYLTIAGMKPPSQTQMRRWAKSRTERYRQPNAHDAVSYMNVFDALMNVPQDIILRANMLTDYLNSRYPTLIWDSYTVGKILTDFYEYFSDAMGEGKGLLWRRDRDREGAFYLVRHNQLTVALAWKVREELLTLFRAEMKARNRGERLGYYPNSPLQEIPSLQVKWTDDD